MSDYFGAMGTAIYGQLAAGTALISALGGTAIYADQAPDGAALPYVVFSHQGDGPDTSSGSTLREGVWFARAYAATKAAAASLDGLIDARLHTQSLNVSGWTNIWLVRELDHALVENPPNGEKIYMCGGTYRITIAK